MDDGVGRAPQRSIGIVQSETVSGDVAGHGRDARGDGVVEVVAMGLAEPIERVVLEDLSLRSTRGRCAATVADEQDQLTVRDTAQQPLDQCGADEPG